MARSLALRFVPPISFVLAASAGDDIGPSAYRQVGAPRIPNDALARIPRCARSPRPHRPAGFREDQNEVHFLGVSGSKGL